jgi:hypothetical protein
VLADFGGGNEEDTVRCDEMFDGLEVYDISSLGIMFQDAHQLMR